MSAHIISGVFDVVYLYQFVNEWIGMKVYRGSVAWGGGGPSLGMWLVTMGTGEECVATSTGAPSKWIWVRRRWGLGMVREELKEPTATSKHPISYRINLVHVEK